MDWLVAEKMREIVEGVLSAANALREAQEAEAEGNTLTAISYAYVHVDVDALTRVISIRTGNHFFGGDRDEVRRGKLGEWAIVWERRDIGVATGEHYLMSELLAWLLRHTRVEGVEEWGVIGWRKHEEYGDW